MMKKKHVRFTILVPICLLLLAAGSFSVIFLPASFAEKCIYRNLTIGEAERLYGAGNI